MMLRLQELSLCNPEPVLFIYDRKAEVFEHDLILEQRMGAHCDSGLALSDCSKWLFFIGFF